MHNPFRAFSNPKDLHYLINKAYEITIENIKNISGGDIIKERKRIYSQFGVCIKHFRESLYFNNQDIYFSMRDELDFQYKNYWFHLRNGFLETLNLNEAKSEKDFRFLNNFIDSFYDNYCIDKENRSNKC